MRHGLTMGELARLFNGERAIGADLTVVAAEALGARRMVRPDRAGVGEPVAQHAQPESGDAVSRASARIEYSNISVGRGTDQPFEQLGAPWIDGAALAEALNARQHPGHPVLSRHASRRHRASTRAKPAVASSW